MVIRYGVVGSTSWGAMAHAPAATASERVDYVGSFGRSDDFDVFLESVDAIGFAVPPLVQVPLALRAIEAGKHVLLEKPIALDLASAQQLADAVQASGVASIVFLTKRFTPTLVTWLERLHEQGPWLHGRVEAFNPYLLDHPDAGWRAEYGALWDVGPHVLSMLCGVLGPVSAVSAVRGDNDVVVASLVHESGAASSFSTSLAMPGGAGHESTVFAGPSGRAEQPPLAGRDVDGAVPANIRAIAALADQIESGEREHPCDVRFGLEIVRVLDAAERSIAVGGTRLSPLT
jgi:predicted dehydrogenase